MASVKALCSAESELMLAKWLRWRFVESMASRSGPKGRAVWSAWGGGDGA